MAHQDPLPNPDHIDVTWKSLTEIGTVGIAATGLNQLVLSGLAPRLGDAWAPAAKALSPAVSVMAAIYMMDGITETPKGSAMDLGKVYGYATWLPALLFGLYGGFTNMNWITIGAPAFAVLLTRLATENYATFEKVMRSAGIMFMDASHTTLL